MEIRDLSFPMDFSEGHRGLHIEWIPCVPTRLTILFLVPGKKKKRGGLRPLANGIYSSILGLSLQASEMEELITLIICT